METISTVFLDRDGVINRLRSDYVLSWETFELLPRVTEAIRLLNEAGMRVIVVTNQRAVARGLLSPSELTRIHENLRAEMVAAGANIDAIYTCPHDRGVCDCRKPQVGLFLQAQRDFPDIDFHRSVVIGDSLTDMQAGHALGCQCILVTETGCADRPGDASVAVEAAGVPVDGTACTLYEAVRQYVLKIPERVPAS